MLAAEPDAGMFAGQIAQVSGLRHKAGIFRVGHFPADVVDVVQSLRADRSAQADYVPLRLEFSISRHQSHYEVTGGVDLD